MLKWTVSRSLPTSSSTSHGPTVTLKKKTPRRPFRDLSNTPPAVSTGNKHVVQRASNMHNTSAKLTVQVPRRRRRCCSHSNDLRSYFQATKARDVKTGKRQSLSQELERSSNFESFYEGTPRVDADIGSLTLLQPDSKHSTASTLPMDPTLFPRNRSKKNFQSYDDELPQNIVNEARANLQSHVSDFFRQISMATSPEDVMETEPVLLNQSEIYCMQNFRMNLDESDEIRHQPKLARVSKKIRTRCKTPYYTKITHCRSQSLVSPSKQEKNLWQTPLAGKLSSLVLDQDLSKFENTDNTVTEVLGRENEINFGGKAVTEILLHDIQDKATVFQSTSNIGIREKEDKEKKDEEVSEDDHTYGRLVRYQTVERMKDCKNTSMEHSDSSVSSASQLLEDLTSPIAWAFSSPLRNGKRDSDDGEFTLKRQRGIRGKRRRRQQQQEKRIFNDKRLKKSNSLSGSPSTITTSSTLKMDDSTPLLEAINFNVKKLPLETDLDSIFEDKQITSSRESFRSIDLEYKSERIDLSEKGNIWEMESPKSSLTEEYGCSSKSVLNSASNTPETQFVDTTVRRCLKYSPEESGKASSRPNCHGSIEIEYSFDIDHNLKVRVIRCKDLRRTDEDRPIHAYVKVSLKNISGEGIHVKRTAVHRATPNPVFQETLILPCPVSDTHCFTEPTWTLDIAVWHRDRRARRSELLGCMTLPLPLSQDKEATWHPLESAGSGRGTSTPYTGVPQECGVQPPLSKDGQISDNNDTGSDDGLTYLRHLELEPVDPLTGLPLHPGFTARGGRTPCTVTRRLIRQSAVNQVPWGFSLSWGRPPRVERVDSGSPAERSGLKPGDYIVFVETTNVVTKPRDDILGMIQAATNQLVLEVYRKGGVHSMTTHRPNSMIVTPLQQPFGAANSQHAAVAFSAEITTAMHAVYRSVENSMKEEDEIFARLRDQVFPNLAPDAPPEEELSVREARYWGIMRSGHTRFMTPLCERRDVLSAADYAILFQNLDELLKISEEIRDEGGGIDSYLCRVPRITAAYRRYLSGLQRACCLLVALRRNTGFAKLVCEPAVPHKRRPDLTGVLLLPLEHYREMTRLLSLASPRNCQQVRDLAQGYREATANAGVMEPPRDTGRPLLSLQEVESRLVFAKCKPFTLAMPGRQWLFGGALAKVEGRARLQPSWALLLTDLLVFARVSRDRVLFVTEEPLRLANIAEACFTIRKRPTEFRLQVAINTNGNADNGQTETVGNSGGGCSPHSRPRRRVIILRAPSPELKAVWHNLLQRQIIYLNTGYGGTGASLSSPEESPVTSNSGNNFAAVGESTESPQIVRESRESGEEANESRSTDSPPIVISKCKRADDHHLAQWVRNSHRIPPPDNESSVEEWTAEELAARAPPREKKNDRPIQEITREEVVTANSDVEQQSTASSASPSTVKSNGITSRRNGSYDTTSRENSTSSVVNICRRCHRSGCCPAPPLQRDPFSPLPPKISVVPPTPDLCTRHRIRRNGQKEDSPGRDSPNCTSADGNTEDGSEDDLDCDGEPPYRTLRRFGTMSSLDQDDELLDEQGDDENRDSESSPPPPPPPLPPSTGLRAWTARASNYVVSKMVLLEQLGEGVGGYLLQPPPVPPERTEFSLDPNDEEGATTSGATSGDDIWGTPTSGGPDDDDDDDESFTAHSPPPSNGTGSLGVSGEDNYGLNLSTEDDHDQESENEDCCGMPELSMDQLLLGGGSLGSLRCFLGRTRRRLEPLPEEEDSPGSGKHQVGWW